MHDVVAILVGRRLEQGHSSVDKTNNVVNVFTCMILDVQVSNLEEAQIQCGLRAVLEAMKNQVQHQRSILKFNWSTQVFFIASVPEVRIHVSLKGHLQERHILLDIRFINPSVKILVTKNDLILGHVGIVIKQVETFRSKSRRIETVYWREYLSHIQAVKKSQVGPQSFKGLLVV